MNAARSLLVVMMSMAACARAGEPRPSSAAPSLAKAEISTRTAAVTSGLEDQAEPEADVPATPVPVLAAVEPPAREPAETVEVLRTSTVRAEPRVDAPALGLVSRGDRLAVYERVEAEGCRRDWLAVAPRGFVCVETRKTRRDPTPVLPVVPDGSRVPGVYGKVASDALIYASRDAIATGEGQPNDRSLTVRRDRTVSIDGEQYWRTRYGYVAQDDVKRQRGAGFHGELLGEGLHQPLAWTLPRPTQREVQVHAEPFAEAAVVAHIGARRPRTVLEETDEFIRVEEGWIARRELRIARHREAPAEVGVAERWLDIDLSEQVLVAYEGTEAVYATMISSGRPGHRTPTGVYRISRKVAERTMNSMPDSTDLYSVDSVPWTAYFANGYALHAAFWHGGFGRTKSHGCVNLAPYDARALYDWMAPLAASGWSEVYGHADQLGSLVRIHSRRDRDPAWRGYAKELREAPTPLAA